MSEEERKLYDSIVDSHRRRGWSFVEAESEALDRIEKLRARQKELGQ